MVIQSSGVIDIADKGYCLLVSPCKCCGSKDIRFMLGDLASKVVCMDCGNAVISYEDSIDEIVWEWNEEQEEMSA